MSQAYFLTVDWCSKGNRGIFCDGAGRCFRKTEKSHTALEIQEILGLFWLILAPESELFTEEQVGEFRFWYPLAEYSNQYGVVHREERE